MERHTPGPWEADWVIRGPYEFRSDGIEGRRVVAHIIDRDEEAETNMYLIAAAPELLEELRALLALVQLNYGFPHNESITESMSYAGAVNAIAKAEGREVGE